MLNDLYQVILHLNTLTHPLSELLQKNVDFDWTEACNEAFEKLKICTNGDTMPQLFLKIYIYLVIMKLYENSYENI